MIDAILRYVSFYQGRALTQCEFAQQIQTYYIDMRTHQSLSLLLTALIAALLSSLCKTAPITLSWPNGVIMSTSQTFQPNTNYLITVTFNSSIPMSTVVQVQFPGDYNISNSTLSGCLFSTTNASSYASASCHAVYDSASDTYSIYMGNIYNATAQQNFLSIQFNITNPWAATSETITVYVGSIASGSYTITYLPSVMNNCAYTSASTVTGATASHTISFTPTVPLLANTYLQATVPTFLTSTTNLAGTMTCTGVTNVDGVLTCGNSFNDPYSELFNISGFVTSTKTLSSAVVMDVGPIRNFWSNMTYSPITYLLQLNGLTIQNCSGISHTATTLGTASSVSNILFNNANISTVYANRTVSFFVRNPFLAASGQLQIAVSTGVSLVYTLNNANVNVTGQNTSLLSFTGLTTGDFIGPTSRITVTSGFTITTPPSSRPFTLTYTTYNISNNIAYGIESITTTLRCITGALNTGTITASSNAVNAITTYTISFKTANTLSTGSYIGVNFPAYTALTNASTCSSNNAAVSCSVSNSSYANLTVTATLTPGTTLTITFNSVKNPNQAMVTASFTIYTYYDSGLDSIVDTLTSGLTLTTISNPITSMTITPASLITYALTTYTISCTLADPIPSGGNISITFPTTVNLGNLTLASASFTNNTCTLTKSSNTATLSSCITSNVTNLTITLVFNNVYNPPSLQPTNSFTMSTYGPLGEVNYISTGVTITMTTPATSSAFSVNTLSLTVHATTQYTFSITTTVPKLAGNYFRLSIPNSMAFSGPSCLPVTGITNITCVIANSTSLVVTLSSAPTASTIVIAINSIRNYDISATAVPFQLFFFSTNTFASENTPVQSLTYTPDTITVVTVNNNDQIALYQNSNITLTVTSPFALDPSFNATNTAVSIAPPSNFTLSSNTTCSSSVGTCVVNSSTIVISAVGLTLNNAIFSINNILLPFINTTSNSFTIAFLYGTLPIATANSAITVSPYCTSPCQRCVSTKTFCATCLPSPNTAVYLYTVNNTCLTLCPNGFYANLSLTCTPCNTPCSYCLDSVNCSKCVNNTWLYGYVCQPVCPITYYNDSTGVCLSCQPPCGNCTTLNNCSSCIVNFYTNFACVNASNCPNGTYGNTTTLTCTPCSTPCSTCISSSLNCTSCVPSQIYYNSSCLTDCPPTMFNNSNSCSSCNTPCGNCTNLTYCLSCTSLFLSTGGQCVNASNCPVNTYPNATTSICTTCTLGCTACSTASNCSGCTSFFFFYNFLCLVSCPNNTYQSGSTCIACSLTCQTCQTSLSKCTSCNASLLLYALTCVNVCPNGTYPTVSNCITCSSTCLTCLDSTTCSSCNNGLFLSGSQCSPTCPAGTFQSYSPNNCSACSITCSTCSGSPSTCLNCNSSLVLYASNCIGSCPDNYFNVSGQCQTCGNCNNCSSAVICQVCLAGYFMLNGVCYGTCPSTSIANLNTYSCTVCDANCFTCSNSLTSCSSCKGGMFLLSAACVSSCPAGYTSDPASGTCLKSLLGNIVYFPTLITFLIWFLIVIYSKYHFPSTEAVTSLCGGLAIITLFSWLILLSTASTSDQTPTVISVILALSLTAIIGNIAIGLGFNIWLRNTLIKKDNGFVQWVQRTDYNLYSYRAIGFISLVCFPAFRLLYCRLYTRKNFSCFFLQGAQLLSISTNISLLVMLLTLAPMLFVCGYIIYLESTYSQILLSAIDALILTILLLLLLILDIAGKDPDYFDRMIEDQPYLKHFRYQQVDDSFASMRQTPDKPRRHRTQIIGRQQEEFFRTNVHCIDNLNKFGHLSAALQPPLEQRRVKTLPVDLQHYPQLDPNDDEIIVINDDLFFQDEQNQRQNERKQREREEQQQQQRQRRQQLEQQEMERIRRKKLMEEDAADQEQIEFPDIFAIDKIEHKGDSKKNPASILSHFKKVEDKPINEKARKKLEDLAKKNGISPEFMTETFGVEKHHNPELLNAIIDIHNHVNRDAVKQLFAQSSNPQILQELFSKNSTLNPERLRELMNDPAGSDMLTALLDKEAGVVAPELAKLMLENNSKYSPEFVKELLTSDNGIPADKLKALLRDNPDKAAREATLLALKKIGGDQLQNKQLLHNLLGEDSPLEASNFLRVTKDLPKEVVQRLFGSQSQTNNVLIDKILNNKKINLKNMATILEDPELLEQLAQVLSGGSETAQQNLINLFMNGQPLNPELLKEMLDNPVLMERLLERPVDPAFLGAILGKDAKTDLTLLQHAVEHMDEQQLTDVFAFNPEKNIDVQKIAQLFEDNPQTDPELIAHLLTPEVLASVYAKSSTVKAEMLNRLVQKGKSIDPDSIIKIYGQDRPNYEMEKKYNITDNNFNLNKQEMMAEMENGQKGNGSGMSRTAGGMMGFLSPIHVALQGRKAQKGKHRPGHNNIDDISDEGVTIYNEEDENQDDEDSEESEENGKAKKGKRRLRKKPLDDIRLPSEKIYLQRLQAPHETDKNKNLRRKKKKTGNRNLQAMDDDNEVYDLDF